MEGELDTSHFGFLHAGNVEPEDVPADNLMRYTVTNAGRSTRSAIE